MQKSSDPRYVDRAFQALGVPLENNETSDFRSLPPIQPPDSEVSQWQVTCQDLIPRLLDDFSANQLGALAAIWFTAATPEMHDQAGEIILASKEKLQVLVASLTSEEQAWKETIDEFKRQWSLLDFEKGHNRRQEVGFDSYFEQQLTQYLDQRLVIGLEDASVWHHREEFAFARFLQRSIEIHASPAVEVQPAPLISTLQLESQHSLFKGAAVRFRGRVHQIDLANRHFPQWKLDLDYWVVWMQGSDQASQPVAAYIPQQIMNSIEFHPTGLMDTEIELRALVGKRLAYSSASGLQIAPTLFASHLELIPQTSPMIDNPQIMRDLVYAIVLGLLLGGILLLPILGSWRRRKHQVARRPSTHSKDGYGRLPDNTSRVWWIIFTLASLCPGNENFVFAQSEVPPWVKPAEGDRLAFISQRLQATFHQTNATELAPENRSTGVVDDAVLKTLNLMQRMQWPDVSQLRLELPEHDLMISGYEAQGQVLRADSVPLTESQSDWSGDSTTFLIEFLPEDTNESTPASQLPPLNIFCTHVPSQWPRATQIVQPAVIQGLLITSIRTGAKLVAVSQPPRWVVPSQFNGDAFRPHIQPNWLALSHAGWDLAALDTLARNEKLTLQADESVPFYSLLRILADTKLDLTSDPNTDPFEVISHASDSILQTIRWPVRLVRGTRVNIGDEADLSQLNAPLYYQFDGFVMLGARNIQLQIPTANGNTETLRFEGEFPVTIVSAAPSEFLPHTDESTASWEVGEFATVTGVFYRLWSYQSDLVEQKQSQARQVAPLVVAQTMRLSAPPIRTVALTESGWFGAALCLAVLLLLGGILFSAMVLDRSPRRASTASKSSRDTLA
ncbi:MAG: hypothetical protein KDB03_17955 [Planctomycetales bacterium]|nr:hypothetical protein [Planctomycetales bacterium]